MRQQTQSSPQQAVIDKVKELHRYSIEADQLRQRMEHLKRELVELIPRHQLEKSTFDFSSRQIRYRSYQDYGQISQRLVREVLNQHYPMINANEFFANLRKHQTVRTKQCVEIVRKRAHSTSTS